MNGTQLLKWGFWCWVGYHVLKELPPGSLRVNYGVPERNTQLGTSVTRVDPTKMIEESLSKAYATAFKNPALPEPPTVRPLPDLQTVERSEWLELVGHPCVIIILGGRGGGKSALGYKMLEYLKWTGVKLFVLGFPGDPGKLLPGDIGVTNSLEEVPPGSAILVDETYILYHARRTMAKSSVEMSQTINLSRQRNQTLVYVSQEGRQIDINIISQADILVFKEPSPFQLEYERSELKKFAAKAKGALGSITHDRKRYSYVFAPHTGFEGLMQNTLPSFWTPRLSKVFATPGVVKPRAAAKVPLAQKIEKAKELKKQGQSNRQIAKHFGVSPPTITNWLRDYPCKRRMNSDQA